MHNLGSEGLAEEMVQETFVRLWRTAGRFDANKASVGTYLYVMARSVATDIASARRRGRCRWPRTLMSLPSRTALTTSLTA